jgi:D-glycero-alpha-D-manno-heptose-7-phosphate kinase
VITKNYIPINKEKNVYYRSKSPVRISFGGGGSDTSLFFLKNKGAVINTTVSLFTHSILKIRSDSKIIFNSNDLNDSIQFSNIEEMINYDGKFGLIKSIIQAVNPKYGFELYIDSDYPMNSGLGGSAVVASSILGCFNQLRIDKWDQYEISEIAYQAERLHLGVHGGWQDQYATVFGGLNFMEFNKKQNIINPIRLSNDIMLQLEDSLVLCYTGTTHDSGNIHLDQKKKTKEKDVNNRIIKNVELTYEMRNLLLKGKLDQFGKCLDMAWKLKRSFSSKISNKFLNNVYDEALKNGAYGGKLLGAGGGGYFLFYCPSNNRNRLINWINKSKLTYTPISFDNKGLQSWTVRNE